MITESGAERMISVYKNVADGVNLDGTPIIVKGTSKTMYRTRDGLKVVKDFPGKYRVIETNEVLYRCRGHLNGFKHAYVARDDVDVGYKYCVLETELKLYVSIHFFHYYMMERHKLTFELPPVNWVDSTKPSDRDRQYLFESMLRQLPELIDKKAWERDEIITVV